MHIQIKIIILLVSNTLNIVILLINNKNIDALETLVCLIIHKQIVPFAINEIKPIAAFMIPLYPELRLKISFI